MSHSEQQCRPYQQAIELIGKRWTGVIIMVLLDGPRRFNEIAERLKELKATGILQSAFVLVALLLLAACGGDATEGPPPGDFSLRYDWREGSLPPPYHYEYTITLAADGSGLMTMIPDYPGPDVPVWEEPFSLAPEEVDQLHDRLVREGLVRERWTESSDLLVGGASADLVVTVEGRTIEVPSFPVEAQAERAAAIFAAIEAIVPEAIRSDLERRRAEYEAANLQP